MSPHSQTAMPTGRGVLHLPIPAGSYAGFEYSSSGSVTEVTPSGHLESAGLSAGDSWRLFAINGHPLEKSAKIKDVLRRVRNGGKQYKLTFVQPISEPLLGVGIPLPRCHLGVPHLYVLENTGTCSKGTIILLHGSGASDWLGNTCPDGNFSSDTEMATEGGMTELALKFQEAGFTAAVLDSYAGGRREEHGYSTFKRTDDIMAAVQYVKDACLPQPIHIYGKSNGGYALAKFLQLPIMERSKTNNLTASKKLQAKALIESIGSIIIQCPYLNQATDVNNLGRAAADPTLKLPAVLFLLAGEDRMLTQHCQPVDVGVKAAQAIAGSLVLEKEQDVTAGPTVISTCSVHRGDGKVAGRPHVEVRMYSGIGHTFVVDAQDQLITDGSCTPVVDHAMNAASSWFSERNADIAASSKPCTAVTEDAALFNTRDTILDSFIGGEKMDAQFELLVPRQRTWPSMQLQLIRRGTR